MGNTGFAQVSTDCEEIPRETRVLNNLMWVFVENQACQRGYPQNQQVVLKKDWLIKGEFCLKPESPSMEREGQYAS
jgi:hypothetical protein